MGDERAEIEVDDTPYVVISVDGDPRRGFEIVLNDGRHAPLDAETLRAGTDNVLYCRMDDGEEARFLRPAYYALSPWITAEEGGFVLPVQGRRHRIRARSARE